jgi:hypothetical protein
MVPPQKNRKTPQELHPGHESKHQVHQPADFAEKKKQDFSANLSHVKPHGC